MARRVAEITASPQASARLSLIVVACAVAWWGALRRPDHPAYRGSRSADGRLLDDLAYGSPTRRVPTVSNGRDEINAMGESLNALVDHRATFMDGGRRRWP